MKGLYLIPLLLIVHVSSAQELEVLYEKGNQWELVTDTTAFDWKDSYTLKAQINVQEEGDYVLQAGNWYMACMQFLDAKKRFLSQGNNIKLHLQQGDTTIFIHYPFIDQKSSVKFNVQLLPRLEFVEKEFKKNVFQAFFLSIVGFLVLITLVFIIRSNDKVYIHYGFYLFSVLYFFAYQYGILGLAIPVVNQIPPAIVWISSASLSMSYLFFSQSFLDLRHEDPFNFKLMRFGQYYVGSVVIIESVSYLFDYDIQHALFYKLAVVGFQVPLMLIFLYRVYLLKNTLSYIFLAGASILVLTTLVGQSLSTFQLVVESNQIIQGGLLLDIFIFSFGIGVRVGLIYEAREEAQNKLIDQLQLNETLQQQYTTELEKKVEERTSEIIKKNQENETLLKEIHHRVKNNLQMISSLLNIQARRLNDTHSREILNVTKTRIRSIGLIHEHLYSHDHLAKIDLKPYIEDLVEMLRKAMFTGEKLTIDIQIDNEEADFNTAMNIGLVLNELVTNSLKYAFVDHPDPKLTIQAIRREEEFQITVHDNGPGIIGEPGGFGWSIIRSTLESVDGQLEYGNENGFYVRILINDYILA